MKPIFSVTLPIELKNGNAGRVKTWHQPATRRKKYERTLRRLKLVRTPFEQVVVVHVTRILGKGQRYWDSSSGLAGNYKEIEDAMVAVGFFTDDSPRYISETRFFQDGSRRKSGPAVLVEVFMAGGYLP